MISEEHQEYYKLIDASILRELNALLNGYLNKKDYHGFFEPDVEAVTAVDDRERQFKVDAANFIENAFCIKAEPTAIGNILASVLLKRGWCE